MISGFMSINQAIARVERMARSLQQVCNAIDPLVEGEEHESALWDALNALDITVVELKDRRDRTKD